MELIAGPAKAPPERLLLQNAEQPVWLQNRNLVLQRTEEGKLIFIGSDLFYKHKTCSNLNSLKWNSDESNSIQV